MAALVDFSSGTQPPSDVSTLSSERQLEGAVIAVRRDVVRLRGGQEQTYDVVEHAPSAAVVALDDTQRVLLLHQWRHAVGRSFWEVPAGSSDPGEDIEEAARRELAEETGYGGGRWRVVTRIHNSPGYTDEEVVVFLAEGVRREGEPDREPAEEEMQLRWVPLDEAVEAVLQGELTVAPTVAGLLAVAVLRARGAL
ncbi:MAG: NUDIX hydrolase [Actinomycetota bacterium]|nr:NUDIX hydrolase [Actinomycetota bacterium]